MKKKTSLLILRIVVVCITLFIWYIFTLNQTTAQKLIFPGLKSIVLSLFNNFDTIFTYFYTTWYRVLAGLLIGAFIGLLVSLIITWSIVVENILDPFIEIIRPIPPIALTPFFILWFGLGDESQLSLIALGSFMVVVVTTVGSIKNVPPIYIRAAQSLGANDFYIYKTIIIPYIMPSLSSGLRIASGTAFGLTVAAEYLGAQGGLGFFIRNARTVLQTESILLAALLLGLQSLLTDQLIRFVFNKVTHWLPRKSEN